MPKSVLNRKKVPIKKRPVKKGVKKKATPKPVKSIRSSVTKSGKRRGKVKISTHPSGVKKFLPDTERNRIKLDPSRKRRKDALVGKLKPDIIFMRSRIDYLCKKCGGTMELGISNEEAYLDCVFCKEYINMTQEDGEKFLKRILK